MKKKILCYGDSNTWGYTPGTGVRMAEDVRWTGRLQKLLGADYQIIACGMNARTTSFDDPYRDYLNGRKGLPYSLVPNKPIDLVIVSLGTNDLKYTNAAGSARGLSALLDTLLHADTHMPGSSPVFHDGPKVLVISPIALGQTLDKSFPDSEIYGKYQESLRFAQVFQPVCDKFGVEMLNAAAFASASEADCVHMAEESHASLACAIYEKIIRMDF